MPEKMELYEVVGKEDHKKRPDLKVILLDYVEGLGVAGQVVGVRPGRMRWDLLPTGKAAYASPQNMTIYKELLENSDKTKTGPSSAISTKTAQKLESKVFCCTMNNKNSWVIEKWHLRVVFRKAGLIVPEEAIELPKTPIKGPDVGNLQDKMFLAFVTINGHERVPVKCLIHHVGQPYKYSWFTGQKEPVLPQEQGALFKDLKFMDPPPQGEEQYD
jgi:large subunit ribosomal protein L9